MRNVNARVQEFGRSPFPAEYLATRRKDGKMYMEIRGGKSQFRKFVDPKYVTLEGDVKEVLIDKVHELVLR